MEAHDQALGRLVASLAASGRGDDTAVIVTSDVAASDVPPVPFVDNDSLDEALLATPLIVRWPHGPAFSERRVSSPTSSIDIARTVLAALRLAPPTAFQGIDLARVALDPLVSWERPLVATRSDRLAVRWGPFVLVGAGTRETRMCDLSLDPACVADVRATSPLALESLHRWAVESLRQAGPPRPTREAAMLDERRARRSSDGAGCRTTTSARSRNERWAEPWRGRSGERGIRTLGTLAGTHDFQSCTFGHSVISPGAAQVREPAGHGAALHSTAGAAA